MTFVFVIITVFFTLGFLVFILNGSSRRDLFFKAPFPRKWEHILRQNIPVYSFLPNALRKKFLHRIKEFLSEKTFEPCGGLSEISDEIAVTIAGYASLLVTNRGGEAWRTLHSVLVYPRAFTDPESSPDETEILGGFISQEREPRDGESWTHGSVVLSWQRILHDIAFHGNGRNVIIHEFAHQLDSDDGIAGGRPIFCDPVDARAWQIVSAQELNRLRSGDPETIIDDYGTENPAEFFATSVEAFFEKSSAMKRAHPELYMLLTRFFALDPASWERA